VLWFSWRRKPEEPPPVPDVNPCKQCRYIREVLSLLYCSVVAPSSPGKVNKGIKLSKS